MQLTAQQVESLRQGNAVRVNSPEVGGELVVVAPAEYERLLEQAAAATELEAWSELAAQARQSWAEENPD